MATTGPALWPGSSTFPGTSVYPGQGDRAIVRCYVSLDDASVSTPTWTDYTSRMRSWATERGRSSELEQMETGSATVSFDDRDRTLDPTVNALIRPLNRVWVFEEFSGEVQDIFKGYAYGWQHTYDPSGIVDAIATVSAFDELGVLALDTLATSGTIAQSTTGAVISALLDLSTAHAAPRNLYQGRGLDVANDMVSLTGQTPKTEIDNAMSLEQPDGAFFASRSGVLTMLDYNHRSGGGVYGTAQITFDDDGTNFPYLDFVTDYSSSFLFNSIVVKTPSATVGTASDAPSIATYFKRGKGYSLPAWFAADSARDTIGGAIASAALAKYKAPFTRVTSISPNMNDAETARLVFRSDLMYKIQVLRHPPGGGVALNQTTWIQKIEMSGSPGVPISCTLTVSPL